MKNLGVLPVRNLACIWQRTERRGELVRFRKYSDEDTAPVDEELHACSLASVDEIFALLYLTLRIVRENGGIPEIGDLVRDDVGSDVSKQDDIIDRLTPNTTSLPSTALVMESTFQRSASTTCAPRSLSFCADSDEGLRVTARGVKVPSARMASMTEEPVEGS